jgi:hypothetical protein
MVIACAGLSHPALERLKSTDAEEVRALLADPCGPASPGR